ncbi:MAG: 16S rRNA (cytosine(967)-C(5))-methyltransferase RsmB [Clostridiales bacterium]|nr:16S rRNA (cytosine(967)-C(5))-methyltransferase RsmB [Clostridiales bacterium]
MNQINVRKLAVNVLTAITYKKEYMNEVLARESANIKREEHGYLFRVVNGVVENLMFIDSLLQFQSKIKISKLRENDKNILRLGIYEIIYMDSIPSYASVNEMARLMKKSNHQLVKYTNGIMRNFAENYEQIMLDFDQTHMDDLTRLSVNYSHPKWMVNRWVDFFGIEETEKLLRSNNLEPELSIRTNVLKTSRDDLMHELSNLGFKVRASFYVPEGIIIESMNHLELFKTKWFSKGYFTVQDESSMLVGHILSPAKGEKILDMCAAPGGKVTHLAQLMEDEGEIIARDISYEKLFKIKENTDRLGFKSIKFELKDASLLDEESIGSYDRVLLDAPCSGLGIIRRKPDIKWQRQLADHESLNELQIKMINNASKYVKIGGVLVYSTCTIDELENDEVIKTFLNDHPDFIVDEINQVSVDLINDNYLKIYPHKHHMDGFFACRLKKV